MVKISSDFDGGNIVCIDAGDHANVRLEIKPDGKADFFQWFYYRVEGAERSPLVMHITNAHAASYARAWSGYRAVASYDRETWFRVETAYDGQALTIRHHPEHDVVYYAFFAPYTTSRYGEFIAKVKASPLLAHEVAGKTLDGQEIDYFRTGDGPRAIWVIARQHPGESMGSWWMEGFLERLSDAGDETVKTLREKATLHVIPCMNLDGARRGHLRTNAAGKDLNRAWRNTTMEDSPEVFLVRERMRATGVDLFLDVHGDEEIPNNFLDSAKGVPLWDERHERLFNRFSAMLLDASKDFQTREGYPSAAPGKANLDVANSYVAQTWNCLSMTLEMPFKDANVHPDPVYGWSPPRCRQFARAHVDVMAQMVDQLR